MRKLLGTSFSETSLRSQQPTIESFADVLIDRFRALLEDFRDQSRGVVVDMVDWINYFTVDVIGDLAVEESFDCLRNSDYHPWVKNLFNFLQGMVLQPPQGSIRRLSGYSRCPFLRISWNCRGSTPSS